MRVFVNNKVLSLLLGGASLISCGLTDEEKNAEAPTEKESVQLIKNYYKNKQFYSKNYEILSIDCLTKKEVSPEKHVYTISYHFCDGGSGCELGLASKGSGSDSKHKGRDTKAYSITYNDSNDTWDVSSSSDSATHVCDSNDSLALKGDDFSSLFGRFESKLSIDGEANIIASCIQKHIDGGFVEIHASISTNISPNNYSVSSANNKEIDVIFDIVKVDEQYEIVSMREEAITCE